jgi:hypothetical protein
MIRRLCLSLVVVTSLLLLASCRPYLPQLPAPPDDQGEQGGPVPTGGVNFDPHFLPITLRVDFDGTISVSASGPKIWTPIGTVTVDAGVILMAADRAPMPPPAGITQLIVCVDEPNKRCEAYKIDTGRRVRVLLDGRFYQDIERNRIMIHGEPGASIRVLDAGLPITPGGEGPPRIDVEEFDFGAGGADTVVDMERSRSGVTPDLAYDQETGELKLINGAQISHVTTSNSVWDNSLLYHLPSEPDCQQSSDWRGSFTPAELDNVYILACVKTAETDLGYVLLFPNQYAQPVSYYAYTYIWVRSTENV